MSEWARRHEFLTAVIKLGGELNILCEEQQRDALAVVEIGGVPLLYHEAIVRVENERQVSVAHIAGLAEKSEAPIPCLRQCRERGGNFYSLFWEELREAVVRSSDGLEVRAN